MTRTTLLLALGISLGATAAPADDSVLWKNVGDWEISIDTTIDNGCYAVASWNGGTVLRIGLNPQEDNFYMLIGNDKWTSLKPDQDYEIQINSITRPLGMFPHGACNSTPAKRFIFMRKARNSISSKSSCACRT